MCHATLSHAAPVCMVKGFGWFWALGRGPGAEAQANNTLSGLKGTILFLVLRTCELQQL